MIQIPARWERDGRSGAKTASPFAEQSSQSQQLHFQHR